MSQKEDEKRIAINQVKELLSILLPEKNMRFIFNLPGGCESPEHLKNKIKIEITEFI